MKTVGKPRGNITGQAFGKTRQIAPRNRDGMIHAKIIKNSFAESDFLKRLDQGWRDFWMRRGTVLPHVPDNYVITYNGELDDTRGLSPL